MSAPAPAAPAPVPQIPERPSSRRLRRMLLMVLVPVSAVTAVSLSYLRGGRVVETDNAYVKADKVPVSAEVGGVIREVMVKENQSVAAGQVLLQLDTAPFEVAVASAEARLAQARTDLAAMKASYREKQAQITLARTRHDFAVRDEQRQADLAAKRFISASRFDDAKQNADLAAQQITALEQDLKRVAEALGGSIDSPVEQHPSYRAAMAEVSQARLDLARTKVHASLPGIVSRVPRPGQHIGAGATALALVVGGDLWVEANFTETDLTYVRPGQPVAIHIDTFPEHRWKGTVDSLSPATGSEFSVIPAQNASGNWVKIAQRVPVRIKLEGGDDMPALRAGMSTKVEIDTGHVRRLADLLR